MRNDNIKRLKYQLMGGQLRLGSQPGAVVTSPVPETRPAEPADLSIAWPPALEAFLNKRELRIRALNDFQTATPKQFVTILNAWRSMTSQEDNSTHAHSGC